MADMGFLPQVEWLLRHIDTEHQTLLFSATLDGAVDTLVRRYQTDPALHEVESRQVTVDEMIHRFIQVHEMDKVKVTGRIARSADRTPRVHQHQTPGRPGGRQAPGARRQRQCDPR